MLVCPGTGVKGDCEPLYVGVGNQAWALSKISVLIAEPSFLSVFQS